MLSSTLRANSQIDRVVCRMHRNNTSTAFLVAQLRDSQGYLQDDGWHEVSRLMGLAAEELERLAARVLELEAITKRRAVG